MKLLTTFLAVLMLMLGVVLHLPPAHAQPRGVTQQHNVFLPLATGNGSSPAPPVPAPSQSPAPNPPSGNVPAALAGTWFAGALLPRELYDPASGRWGNANGLGQMYEFAPTGSFSYWAFFRVENPGCTSEVSVYRQGTADAAGATLTLRPTIVKTRTATYCGTPKETITDGPYDAQSLPWSVEVDTGGVNRLTLRANGTTEQYARFGMAESLVGTWQRGEIRSTGFYDPAGGAFASSPGEGWWVSLAADGSYRWGEYGHTTDGQGCALTAWLYQEGRLAVAGSHVTFTPATGVARVYNACSGQTRQEPYSEDATGFTWLLRDRQTSPTLVLIPDGRFQEYVFVPE